jgi:putative AdoMet-dependent methyltransferase
MNPKQENDAASAPPAWQWNEIQQIGTDYEASFEVERYERRMGEYRDLAAEDAAILQCLDLPRGAHLLEIGTGTGHFARAARRAGLRVTALDVSPTMLGYAKASAESAGLNDIQFHQAGFLTLASPPATFDAAVSVLALHHLPDLWKALALHNMRRVLKPGAPFFLGDIVFSSRDPDPSTQFDAFLDLVPPTMREETIEHIAKEFSTLDWIMEGLLARAGFAIQQTLDSQAPLMQYLCRAETRSSPDRPQRCG